MMPRGSVTPRAMNTAAIIQRSAAAVKHITQKYHHRSAELIRPPRRSNGPWRAARQDATRRADAAGSIRAMPKSTDFVSPVNPAAAANPV